MSFRSRSKPSNPSKIVLPITPMLDMTFQLLFFFIVNFKGTPPVPLVEGSMEMALPTSQQQQMTSNPNKAKDERVDAEVDPVKEHLKNLMTVKVKSRVEVKGGEVRYTGQIDSIVIHDPVNCIPRPENLKEATEVPVEGGLDGLTKLLRKRTPPVDKEANVTIKVQGDGKLKVRELVRVMDACRAADFERVSMTPPDDFNKRTP